MTEGSALDARTGSLTQRPILPMRAGFVMALLALVMQALLTAMDPAFTVLNLPLLVVIYAVLTLRAVIPAIVAAMLVGWAQDGLNHEPVGMFGTAYAILAYLAATFSRYFKVGLALVLGVFVAALYFLHEVILFAMRYYLLGQVVAFDLALWIPLTALHAGLALLLYPLCDRLVAIR